MADKNDDADIVIGKNGKPEKSPSKFYFTIAKIVIAVVILFFVINGSYLLC